MAQTKELTVPKELMGKGLGAYTIDEMVRLSQICQASGIFEDVSDAAQAFVKIAKGQELGLPPMTAMAAFDLIRKRLYLKPWAMAAKINTCGYGTYAVQVQTADCCTILFRRKYPQEGWKALPLVSYTFAEARGQGLAENSKHWKSTPAHMLYQRAMGRGAYMYFPELFAGLSVPPEDTPVSAAQCATHVQDLYGPGVDPTLPVHDVTPPPAAVNFATGEVLEDEPPLFGWPDRLPGLEPAQASGIDPQL